MPAVLLYFINIGPIDREVPSLQPLITATGLPIISTFPH